MGLIDIISDIIQENRIAKANRNRRGLVLYKPSQVGGFVEADIYKKNTIVSGGTAELRSEVIVNLCVAATNDNIPVIILHQGDSTLGRAFNIVYNNHPAYQEVGPGSKKFDPFYHMSNTQISKIIVDTALPRYGLTSDGEAYIDVLTGFLAARGRMITLKGLSECPHTKLPQLINSAANSNTLLPATVQELQTNLALGQKESRGVNSYLKQLYAECIQILPKDKASYRDCVSVFQTVKNSSVLSLDVVSENNTLLLKIIAEQLQILIRNKKRFLLILDNISLREDNSMKKLCSTKSGTFNYVVSGDDVFSMCEGNDKHFGSLLGFVEKWFVFQHSSGISAEKWSSAFSKYLKIDTSYNYGRGNSKGSGVGFPFGGGISSGGANWMSNKSFQQGVSYSNKDEAIIRAEEIRDLPVRGGFIYTSAKREIAKVEEFLPL